MLIWNTAFRRILNIVVHFIVYSIIPVHFPVQWLETPQGIKDLHYWWYSQSRWASLTGNLIVVASLPVSNPAIQVPVVTLSSTNFPYTIPNFNMLTFIIPLKAVLILLPLSFPATSDSESISIRHFLLLFTRGLIVHLVWVHLLCMLMLVWICWIAATLLSLASIFNTDICFSD